MNPDYLHLVLADEIERRTGLDADKVFSGSREREYLRTRQVIMLVMHRKFKISRCSLAKLTNSHHTNIARGIRTCENHLRRGYCDFTLRNYKIAVRFSVRLKQKIREMEAA